MRVGSFGTKTSKGGTMALLPIRVVKLANAPVETAGRCVANPQKHTAVVDGRAPKPGGTVTYN